MIVDDEPHIRKMTRLALESAGYEVAEAEDGFQALELFGDGSAVRDFVYVDDCVDIMLWLYQNEGVNGLFNVGSGVARSFKDLAEACYSALGQAPKIEYIDMPDHLKTKYQYFTQASMDKLRAAGYSKPTTTLEDGVRAYMQDYMVKADQYK